MGTYKNILRYGDGICTGKMNYFSPAGYIGCIKDKDLTSPPTSPSFGDAYIVASGATGDWAGKDKQIAVWNGYNWDFVMPTNGTLAYVQDESLFYHYWGGLWLGHYLSSSLDHPDVAIFSPADGEVLTYDASANKWTNKAPGGGGITKETMALRKTGSSLWYSLPATGSPNTSSSPNGGYLLAIPFITVKSITLDRIGVRVSYASNPGSKARLGIYRDNDDLYPGFLLLDAGEVETSSTGFKELTINLTLEADKVYWLVMNSTFVGPYPSYYAYSNDRVVPILGFTTSLEAFYGWTYPQGYGALPNPFPGGGSPAGSLPAIFVRVA